MTQGQDIVERLLDSRAIFGAPTALEAEAAQTIAALRAERDEAFAESHAVSIVIGSVRFMDPPDGGSVTLAEQVNRMRQALEAAEAKVKELEAECKEWEEDDHPRALQVDRYRRERDEARKALAEIDEICEPHTADSNIARLVHDIARIASSNREGGE
jgi:DNA repair exonuclease SbcCD ATPase subunit